MDGQIGVLENGKRAGNEGSLLPFPPPSLYKEELRPASGFLSIILFSEKFFFFLL